MGKKYIIELEDGEHPYKTTINVLGSPVLRAAEKIPYTELNLEQAKDEAYNEVYKAGREAEKVRQPDLEQVRKEAYEKGFEDGKGLCPVPEVCHGNAYQKGLSDAWEAARKIQDAGRDLRWWLHNYTAQEAIDRLTYEVEKDSIKIWDEVKAFEKKPFIVTGFGYGDDEEDVYCHGFVTENGISTSAKKSDCVRTGRHFHDIDEIFKEMREPAAARVAPKGV